MTEQLLNFTMIDSSRHFGELPQTVLWYDLRNHIELLDGTEITGFTTDDVTEAWIDFSYHNFSFSINDQFRRLFVFRRRRELP